ncbi:hypothetical protein EZV62_028102 [Acer yangbiense]|uniref:CCR4-NOT transcription complex subunit 1 CAF1-binding domain-containing protein n=1 Tax=Acer yangbiense TaxID=1000413 RepID=A0A5C7GPH9_9ROSI|nr:hypothetical protein EZV62_028102 [Acer yangbiense]
MINYCLQEDLPWEGEVVEAKRADLRRKIAKYEARPKREIFQQTDESEKRDQLARKFQPCCPYRRPYSSNDDLTKFRVISKSHELSDEWRKLLDETKQLGTLHLRPLVVAPNPTTSIPDLQEEQMQPIKSLKNDDKWRKSRDEFKRIESLQKQNDTLIISYSEPDSLPSSEPDRLQLRRRFERTLAKLVAYIEHTLARISSGHLESNRVHGASFDPLDGSTPATSENVEVPDSSWQLLGSRNTQPSQQPSSALLQQGHQVFLGERHRATATSNSSTKPLLPPFGHPSNISTSDVASSQNLTISQPSQNATSVSAAASSSGFLHSSRGITSTSMLRQHPCSTGFGSVLNIETLIAAAERRDAPIEAPASDVQDKILFMINNISTLNIDAKAKEFTEIVSEQYYPWLAQYVHGHEKFLDKVNSKVLNKEIVKAGYENCKVLLRSELIKSSSEERSLLKNLSSWLGKFTIDRNQVLRARELDPKSLIIEYAGGLNLASGQLMEDEKMVALGLSDRLPFGQVAPSQSPYSLGQALQTIDGEIAQPLSQRKKHRESVGPPFCDASIHTQGSMGVLSETLHPPPSFILSSIILSQDFVRFPWQNQPGRSSNGVSASSGLSRAYVSPAGQHNSGFYSARLGTTGLNATQPLDLISEEKDHNSAQILSGSSTRIGAIDGVIPHGIWSYFLPLLPATSAPEHLGSGISEPSFSMADGQMYWKSIKLLPIRGLLLRFLKSYWLPLLLLRRLSSKQYWFAFKTPVPRVYEVDISPNIIVVEFRLRLFSEITWFYPCIFGIAFNQLTTKPKLNQASLTYL